MTAAEDLCQQLQIQLMSALMDAVEDGDDRIATARVEVPSRALGEEVVDLAVTRLRRWLGGFTFQQGANFGVWKEGESDHSVEVRFEENGGASYVFARVNVDSDFPMPEKT